MITIPVYDMILLPGVHLYLKNEVFVQWNQKPAAPGDDVLFLLLKEQKPLADLTAEDFYPIGFTATVDGIDAEGMIQLLTVARADIDSMEIEGSTIQASASIRPEQVDFEPGEQEKRFEKIKEEYINFIGQFQWGVLIRGTVQRWNTLADMICGTAGYLLLDWESKYRIMAEDSLKTRTELMEQAIYEFMEGAKVSAEAREAQQNSQEEQYREMAIRRQIAYLQQELNSMHPEELTDIESFDRKIHASGMNDTALREAEKVLRRMKQDGENGHEYGMLYDYLDFVTSLIWEKQAIPAVDLGLAEQILEEDHYGMKKVKDRVLQQLAVMAMKQKQTGSILLFVGAPGTGKTSFGKGIARAMGRAYSRISLGGIHDEADIRGHRRTYIGAMPGRIMEAVRRSGSSNPVIVLDEIDKLSNSYHGDPASALLEVLDPEQNSNFTDHYMNAPYDLSNVFFICTANTLDTIPEPLLNRMEVIRFPGYTELDKLQIARRHLLPQALEAAGLKSRSMRISDEILKKVIAEYTAESGVRGLKKKLDELCRSTAVTILREKKKQVTITDKRMQEYLGQSTIHHDVRLEESQPGVVTGLAWTSAGGEILFIETRQIPGSGKLQITGQLGDVMKESVQIAFTLVKAEYPNLAEELEKKDIHVHVPAGATPKDGPSAGVTLTTALASLMTGKAVDPHIGMTGEIDLSGKVLPIGGLPEKLMAAYRAGLTTILIPAENEKDLDEVAAEVRDALKIRPVHTIAEVFAHTGLGSNAIGIQ